MRVVIPSKYVVIPNFLPKDFNENLLTYTELQEPNFVERHVSPNYPPQRSSGAIKGFDAWKNYLLEQVQQILPEVVKKLELDFFPVGEIESDVSAHGNGGFLGIHNDTFPTDADTRVLTFVYYYHSLPRNFTGGQLVIYDSETDCFLRTQKADSCHLVEPENNTCVFFPSHCDHQVLPVACNNFINSRFSLNGWIRKHLIKK